MMESYLDLDKRQFLSWEHHKSGQPAIINYPHEFEGGGKLCVACTQLNLSSAKQKKLLQDWSDFLLEHQGIQEIYLYSRTPQVLLDGICRADRAHGGELNSLFIKWSGNGIRDFSGLAKLTSLQRLYIGSNTQTSSLDFLKTLPDLEWLELHELKKVRDISAIARLHKLRGLIFTGGMSSKQKIDSLRPLARLKNLECLDLNSLVAQSGDLSPLAGLQQLKILVLPFYYEMKEYARLFVSLPDCNHGIAAYRNASILTCGACGRNSVVLPMAARRRRLCLHCNPDKIAALEKEFLELVASLR